MIIKRLTMHNFGVYASTNTFDFSGKKPIVLIGGLNGRGKTTFLNAVLLALYGANSFAYRESSFKSYGQYLRSFVNLSDGSKQTYVEMEMQLNNSSKDIYVVRREWNALGKIKTSEKITVYKNGEYSDFLTGNWTMFVENILPSALSNFFFFDGEKIAELAVDNTDSQLKESIRAMLGISVLDTLNTDLRRNIRKLQKQNSSWKESAEVEKLRDARDRAKQKLKEAEQEISAKEQELKSLTELLEKKKAEYAAGGGDVVEKKEMLLREKTELSTKLEQNEETLRTLAASELPMILVRDLIDHAAEQGEREKNAIVKKQAAEYVNSLFEVYQKDHREKKAVSDFINFLHEETEDDQTEPIYVLSERGLFQAKELKSNVLRKRASEGAKAIELQQTYSDKINEIDNYLSIDIDEEKIQEIYADIRVTEQKIKDCNSDLVILEQKRSSANRDFMRASSEFNKNVGALLEGMETDDDNKRDLKYSEMASHVLQEFSVRLQQRKIGVLGETITDCYKQLANKKNLIDQIVMDPVTLDIKYLNKDGNTVEKTALSAGEKQLIVISILWALAKCSKKKLPVIIDTPLSRMDSNHRKALIQVYFPQASEQTIILSTDSEIDAEYYELMKRNIGDEFTLNYSDETNSTTITRGYFPEDAA